MASRTRSLRARFRATWTAAVLAAASTVIFELAVRAENLRLGYALADAAAERTALYETRQQLILRAQLARAQQAALSSQASKTSAPGATPDAGSGR